MVVWFLVGFVVLVGLLTVVSTRSGRSVGGCCAPADPRHDLRMKDVGSDADEPGRP